MPEKVGMSDKVTAKVVSRCESAVDCGNRPKYLVRNAGSSVQWLSCGECARAWRDPKQVGPGWEVTKL